MSFFIRSKVSIFSLTTLSLLISNAPALAAYDLYAGISGGLDYFSPDREVTRTSPPLAPIMHRNHDSGTGGTVGGFVGLGYKENRWGLAAELAGRYSTAEAKATTENFFGEPGLTAAAKIRHRNTFSLSLLPSLSISPSTDVFVRGGFARSKIQIKSESFGGELIAADPKNVSRNGYIVGAGMNTNLMQNVSMRFEYDYSRFKSIEGNSTLPEVVVEGLVHSKVTPKDHTISLSLVFHDFLNIL